MQKLTFPKCFQDVRIWATALIAVMTLLSTAAQAQATRTWVSGVGDDVNPCSRTAPCRTFAGAISKTALGGEINALDAGGFGSVTITKSIVLDGSSGVIAGVLFWGTTGIIVNAPADSTVVLRNLDLTGALSGIAGIRIVKAGQVFIDNVKIQSAINAGIQVQEGAGSRVFVQNSSLVSVANPSASGTVDNAAIHVKDDASVIYVSNSTIFGNDRAFSLMKDDLSTSTGKIISFNNNRLEGNAKPSAPTGTIYER